MQPVANCTVANLIVILGANDEVLAFRTLECRGDVRQ
jgi:hypothetical protein